MMPTHPAKRPCAESAAHPAGPCAAAPASRNNYFTGKLLTARDLRAEQAYFLDRLRLHDLGLHGWGTVCGLRVVPHPHCPDKKLRVHAGVAIDGCGRVVRLAACDDVDLPAPPPGAPAPVEPCPPESAGDQPEGTAQAAQSAPQPCPAGLTLYVCLRYDECLTEMTPAPFDECACGSSPPARQANRVREGYKLEVHTEPPPGWEWSAWPQPGCPGTGLRDKYAKDLSCLIDHCPQPGMPLCIPLAVVTDYAYGSKVVKERIDNKHRRMVPSTTLLDATLRRLLDALSAPTRVDDIGWHHDHEYFYSKFVERFAGDKREKPGFTITFSGPVRHDGLSPRSFQAVAVRHEKGQRGGFLEVLPADVWATDDPDRTVFHLLVSRHHAQHCLNKDPFDVFLTLRCNVILDAYGCPVDGELRARLNDDGGYEVKPPTGNGMPGGTLESWIHVKPDPAKEAS
jgi:hypothetical protein